MSIPAYRPPRPAIASVLLGVLVIAVAAGATYVLHRVWYLHESDYWSVAVPGVATGGGTLMLAAVTTWLSTTQRMRDDYLRRDDIKRREEERQDAEYNAALREARKVVSYWRENTSDQEEIVVVNAGTESIVELHLIRAIAQPTDQPGIRWQWHPEALVDELDRYHAPSWYRPFVLPGSTIGFKGEMVRSNSDGTVVKSRIGETPMGRRVNIDIAWSDASGRHWRKTGSASLVQLPQPYENSLKES